jgi:hypothetical protein
MNSRRSLSVGVVDENKPRKKRVASSIVDFFRTRVRSPPPPPRPKRPPGPARAPVVVSGGSAVCLAARLLAGGVVLRRFAWVDARQGNSIPDSACGGGGDRTAGCRWPRGSAPSTPPGEPAVPQGPSLGARSLCLRCGVRVATALAALARSLRLRRWRARYACVAGVAGALATLARRCDGKTESGTLPSRFLYPWRARSDSNARPSDS